MYYFGKKKVVDLKRSKEHCSSLSIPFFSVAFHKIEYISNLQLEFTTPYSALGAGGGKGAEPKQK